MKKLILLLSEIFSFLGALLRFAILSSVFCLILCFLLRFLVNSPGDSVDYTIRTDIIGLWKRSYA